MHDVNLNNVQQQTPANCNTGTPSVKMDAIVLTASVHTQLQALPVRPLCLVTSDICRHTPMGKNVVPPPNWCIFLFPHLGNKTDRDMTIMLGMPHTAFVFY